MHVHAAASPPYPPPDLGLESDHELLVGTRSEELDRRRCEWLLIHRNEANLRQLTLDAGFADTGVAPTDAGVADSVVPVTYMNSSADIKAFCGRNGGIVCTSSNASRVYDWAFDGGERILFFPDEHLGRNTGLKKGIPLDKMVVWDPFQPLGGNTEEALRNATVILWKGYCSVHARFTVQQIETARQAYPDVQVIVVRRSLPEVVCVTV